MQTYQSYKRVKAAKIVEIVSSEIERTPNGKREMHVRLEGCENVRVLRGDILARYLPVVGDYLVEYEDGYRSISPKKAFEEGYMLVGEKDPGFAHAAAGDTQGLASAASAFGNPSAVVLDPQEVLMSPDNPTGWKLEDLLARLCREVRAKCAKIADKTETDPVALSVYRNNVKIIELLGQAEVAQRESYCLLHHEKGANKGPTGKPRI